MPDKHRMLVQLHPGQRTEGRCDCGDEFSSVLAAALHAIEHSADIDVEVADA